MTTFSQLPTLLSTDRILNLIKYSNRAAELPGYFVEFGVYKGGSLEILAKFNPTKTVFGIDSFAGLPKPTENVDFHAEGEFNDADFTAIHGYFRTLYPNQVRVLKGFSPQVFEFFDVHSRFAFGHIDVDLYQSCKDAAEFFWPRLVEGGSLLWDDYGFSSTRGAKKAIDEFLETVIPRFHGELKYLDGLSHKQYLIIK